MSGAFSAIRMGNGVELSGEVEYRFDAEVIDDSAVYCISHAHSDHLPKKMLKSEVVCSDITLKCASGRLHRPLVKTSHPSLRSLNAGHMAGSNMFLVEGEKKVLYTGDINIRDRLGIEGAKPVKVDILIIESTYGKPRYVFPPSDEMVGVIHDWVEDALAQEVPVGLFAYPLGKSQDLIHMVGDLVPYIHDSVLSATRMIECEEIPFSYRPYAKEAVKEPFVMICPTQSVRSNLIRYWRRKGMKTAAVSGWALESSYRYRMGVDEAFPYSDHADFNDLLKFVEGCDPSLVLTHHGFADELALQIRKRLGINARPLYEDQRSLLEF